jgi:hypothetical protein
MTGHITAKSLGELIARLLGLAPEEELEVKRDRDDPCRVMVIRHPIRTDDENAGGPILSSGSRMKKSMEDSVDSQNKAGLPTSLRYNQNEAEA